MMKATIPLGLCLLLLGAPVLRAQPSPQQTAIDEDVRRQAARITLRNTLAAAHEAEQRRDLLGAAKLYDAAYELILQIGPNGTAQELRATQVGLAQVRMPLAVAAQKHEDLHAADEHVKDILRVDPRNEAAIEFKRANDLLLVQAFPRNPTPEAVAQAHAAQLARATNSTHVQNGKVLFEAGKYDEAEVSLKMALREDPNNDAANYYLNLISEARYKKAAYRKERMERNSLAEVEDQWAPIHKNIPAPNDYARSTLTHTSPMRAQILSKLQRIHLDAVTWDGLPLSEVIKNLTDEAKKRDPERKGLNFIVNPNAEVGVGGAAAAPGAIDPATGLPVAPVAPTENVDINGVQVKLNLTDVTLADLLNAIITVADKKIKYSIEDYAVVFSLRGAEAQTLVNRIIKVDPNTFVQGLESVVGFAVGNLQVGTGGGGGGGGGQQNNGVTAVPRVNLTAGRLGGQGGGGAVGGTAGGVKAVTATNDMASIQSMVRLFFTSIGVNLDPPKSVFFNDREGSLLVHATLQDVDMIEQGIQVLNITPPQVTIKSKFIEVTQSDAKALGFEYYIGNILMNHGSTGVQAGTAPSFNGRPSTANPEGTFPGSLLGGTTLLPSTTDQLLTSGLRNQLGVLNPVNTPSLFTLSGILTDPQFRVVLHALETRDGSDLLNESSVTTLSGRQCQIQVVDLQAIVSGVQQNAQTSGGTLGGAGTASITVNYNVDVLPVGPSLDVIPYVSADGFTIQMTIIPTITEFLGYDDPGGFVPQAAATGVSLPAATLPLPHLRLRQIVTSAIVWDGQTVVLGGLITEDTARIKDKIPVIGDLPIVGRLFQSQSSATRKRNLMIFVTPTIIDPAGNRYHTEEEMPFAQNGIPKQVPVISGGQ